MEKTSHHVSVPSLCLIFALLDPARVGAADQPRWLGEEMPLPLAVRTPLDLEFKAAAERQYLIFNLLAGGKWAWDQGRFAEAAKRWDTLLKIPRLDMDLAKLLRPLVEQAERRAAGVPSPTPVATPDEHVGPELATAEPTAPKTNVHRAVAVSGSVVGGGNHGPGGAVVWLKRADGVTPKPRPLKHAVMSQIDKGFAPHVLTVTAGSAVTFDNKDPILHDVFSLTKPNDFDSGLFDSTKPYQRVFHAPGALQVLCNIHASMLAYIVVVDTPWYGQAGRDGHFRIHDVPPGKYHLFAWHEASSTVETSDVTVGDGGMSDLVVRVASDVKPANLVPDKYGKPRQRQLGY